MSNPNIKVTACDNELYILAVPSGNANSYVLGHIKSGYNYGVDVTIDLPSGAYAGPALLNGLGGALNKTISVPLGVGTYSIIIVGINWGGPANFDVNVNGTDFSSITTTNKVWSPDSSAVQIKID